MGDKFADDWHVVKNAGLGVWDGLTDLVLGILKLLKGVGEVVLWLALQNPVTSYFGLMPEFLEEDMGEMWSGVKQFLKDPGNIVEAIGQSTFDIVDEKGVAYSVSYVAADVVASLLLDKGLGKLGAMGKADDVSGAAGDVAKYTDEVEEAANKAGKHADDVSKATKEAAGKAVSESGSNSVLTQKNVEMPALPEGSQWERNVLNSFDGGKATPTTYKVGTQGMGLYGGAHQAYIDYRAVPADWIEITPTTWK